REGVECWLPAHRPANPASPGGVEGAGDQIDALQRGLVGREVPACPHGPTVSGVEALDGVRGADDAPDLDVVVEEGDELFPRRAPEVDDGWVTGAPLVGELVEADRGHVRVDRGVDRLEVAGQLVPVAAAGVAGRGPH